MEKALIGRQPIYRDGVEVFAYELFSRNDELSQAASAKNDPVTAEALMHEFIAIGLDRVVGPHSAFVNVTRDFILKDYPWLLPKHGVVLQVAADTPPDTALMKSLSHLARAGYSIALNKFVYTEEMWPLAELAHVIKLNVRELGREKLSEHIAALRSLGGVKLLAEEVESHEDYQVCKRAGFDYFEGYFFCKPQGAHTSVALPSNRLSTLHLLSKLQDPDISFYVLERAVAQDVAMSYRILRYLNSPINALPRKVSSIRHAIALVGTSLIRHWASVIESIEDKPRELMIMAMVRAHMCQQLGIALGCKNEDQFFTVGLLSLMDALLDRPMDTVLNELPLVESVKEALLTRGGIMGEALNCVEAYERCDWPRAVCTNLDEKMMCDAYLAGVAWSRAVIHELVN
jgi:c-di-GMP phosphodiesterase